MFEKEKQFYKEVPIGTGRKSEPKETLPTVEVDNEVLWVNKDFEDPEKGGMPFNLKEGESTKLGVFLTPKLKKNEKALDLRVRESHGRSALLGKAVFCDKQGRLYRDIDLKGIGHISSERKGLKRKKMKVGEVRARGSSDIAEGILDLKYAVTARDKSEKFLEAGIRTERYLGFIKLKEIIDKTGKKISIDEAKKRNTLYEKQEPVVGLRAFGTKSRIEDANKKTLEDARKLVAQESGVDEKDFSWERYLKWFIEAAGDNLGVMHQIECQHGYLTRHNITLDCRIVDLDSVEEFYSPTQKEKEYEMEMDYNDFVMTVFEDRGLTETIEKYTKTKLDHNDIKELLKLFDQAYIKALGYTPKFLTKEENN